MCTAQTTQQGRATRAESDNQMTKLARDIASMQAKISALDEQIDAALTDIRNIETQGEHTLHTYELLDVAQRLYVALSDKRDAEHALETWQRYSA